MAKVRVQKYATTKVAVDPQADVQKVRRAVEVSRTGGIVSKGAVANSRGLEVTRQWVAADRAVS